MKTCYNRDMETKTSISQINDWYVRAMDIAERIRSYDEANPRNPMSRYVYHASKCLTAYATLPGPAKKVLAEFMRSEYLDSLRAFSDTNPIALDLAELLVLA